MSIKAIEGRSVHQIQSGQVISDGLCSAVKELVENSLDAHATSIEIRFKNHGLDCIEVCDNGDGITPENFENLALKHYTSKLISYDDLDNVRTYGFRGEALSSLCALSDMSVTTATKDVAPKGSKLEFHISGKLKSTSVTAAAKGTTVTVENIFKTLPVRRRELERNIKREYGKVLNYLQAYAAICVGVKVSVYNTASGKKTLAFSTKANKTTKENISNIFGAKTAQALVPLTLEFEIEKTAPLSKLRGDTEPTIVKIEGHISRPSVGEGRQTPDRQMFFVNSRPCILPQVSRAFNEIYKGYNITQSPFIFADMIIDTNAYDVNVSPDKRTILLHDQSNLIQALKVALTELFDDTDQIVPHTQNKLPPMKQLTLNQRAASNAKEASLPVKDEIPKIKPESNSNGNAADTQDDEDDDDTEVPSSSAPEATVPSSASSSAPVDSDTSPSKSLSMQQRRKVFGAFTKSHAVRTEDEEEDEAASQEDSVKLSSSAAPKPVSSLWDRMKSASATCSSASGTTVSIGSNAGSLRPNQLGSRGVFSSNRGAKGKRSANTQMSGRLMKKLKSFAAPGTQMEDYEDLNEETNDAEEDGEDEEVLSAEESDGEDMEIDGDEATQEQEVEDEEEFPMDGEDDNDADYINEAWQKAKEKDIVDRLLKKAEDDGIKHSEETRERAKMAFRTDAKDHTFNVVQSASTSHENLQKISMRRSLVRSIASRAVKNGNTNRQQASLEGEEGNNAQQAEERLSLTIKKSDFAKMRIVGQFNLGFILTTRGSEETGKDMFIIDQHASDEKYNFERLQVETTVQNQPLVVPKVLELTAPEEVTVMENLDTLRKNGFIVEVDEEAQTGRKCRLKSLPMSKEVTFGVKDLEELIQLIEQHPNDHSVRPSKVRSMFAMRACRSSIMIGRSLTHKTMTKLVTHMGELDKPWNCPHGRPTMRHVWDVGQLEEWRDDDQAATGSKWESQSWKDIVAQAAGKE